MVLGGCGKWGRPVGGAVGPRALHEPRQKLFDNFHIATGVVAQMKNNVCPGNERVVRAEKLIIRAGQLSHCFRANNPWKKTQ